MWTALKKFLKMLTKLDADNVVGVLFLIFTWSMFLYSYVVTKNQLDVFFNGILVIINMLPLFLNSRK
jgi:hypothetical protein